MSGRSDETRTGRGPAVEPQRDAEPSPRTEAADSSLNTEARGGRSQRLRRLLAPRHIAVVGGASAAEAVRQCRAIGFTGRIWPVHPRREHIEGLPCHRTVADLPEAPDAALVAVPNTAAVPVLAALSARGAGGAVCYAAGFAEDGADGARLQEELREAAAGMPVIGPNCIGVLNYLDGSALWADQHGGARVASGVAVITQSGNIAQNLTMQRRSVPLAYVVTAGNGAVTGVPELIESMLDDPRVSAIGLHLEGIDDVAGFSRAALAALDVGIPVVALKTGSSALGARANLSHTSSLAGSDVLCDALFRRLGVARVHEVGTFLETLKLLHVHGPLAGTRVTSASCSGGEAALIADAAQQHGAHLPELPAAVAARLRQVLGDHVHVANPLDYHTYIWGDAEAQRACFTALQGSGFDVNLLLLDLPRDDRCAPGLWTTTMDAYTAAAQQTGAPACVVSSLPEGLPEDVSDRLLARGVAPMHGMADCVRAIAAAGEIGRARQRHLREGTVRPAGAAAPGPAPAEPTAPLDEYAAKQELSAHGVRVPRGRVTRQSAVRAPDEAADLAAELGFPVVVKALSPALAHKSEAGGVRVGLTDREAVREAVRAMASLAECFLVEERVPEPVAELLVGVHRDPQFGHALTVGAGGVLVELVRDTATLLLPAGREQIEEALASLRIWPVLRGFRGGPEGDLAAAVDAVHAVARYARHAAVAEIDVNPLLVLPAGRGAVAVDALIRHQACGSGTSDAKKPDARRAEGGRNT
ncbi:acetate--CoA ligase family protein [Streptomyces tubbatahanensis]|uniref:Acetate--CoA ligase family protein n=1 Tax=Streptomyces tubbatahanensis TaxID=2923272 RepID=A0ABY3Y131_9ACTN|nr:acetate--CoA ligase family protein [Streptomyces tubbatahanensis]UNT00475.1 acetate--CoA ligase family protein [Streptomyces tubbatahanensis]